MEFGLIDRRKEKPLISEAEAARCGELPCCVSRISLRICAQFFNRCAAVRIVVTKNQVSELPAPRLCTCQTAFGGRIAWCLEAGDIFSRYQIR